jgi:protein-serine/threonine kinase
MDQKYDGRAVDVWACGVIYIVMRTGGYLWHEAKKDEDEIFVQYLKGRRQEEGFSPIESLNPVSSIPACLVFHLEITG